jgi:hypothetical protein
VALNCDDEIGCADITGKLNQRKQKVKALLEATGWYKQLLSMRCEYSDGKYMQT